MRRMLAPVAELHASMPCNATIRVMFANDVDAANAVAADDIRGDRARPARSFLAQKAMT
ncbi:MAG: hypothetical protein ACI85K_001573 [Hyphomicrobiaceae bacterium]|jgi:hypothetical protein